MASAPTPRNYIDAYDLPICMVCEHNIRPADFATRVDDCLVHGRCLREAFAEPDPCKPRRNGYLRDA